MKTISLKLPEALSANLEKVARERGQSKSAIARMALEAYLAEQRHAKPASFRDAAREWIGCMEGPEDLSSNPKYMEDFGA